MFQQAKLLQFCPWSPGLGKHPKTAEITLSLAITVFVCGASALPEYDLSVWRIVLIYCLLLNELNEWNWSDVFKKYPQKNIRIVWMRYFILPTQDFHCCHLTLSKVLSLPFFVVQVFSCLYPYNCLYPYKQALIGNSNAASDFASFVH